MFLRRLYRRAKNVHPGLPAYLAAAGLMAVSGNIFQTTYNNFLDQIFHIEADTRGQLEFLREFPGLMNMFIVGALALLPETRVAAVAAGITAIGMAGFGVKGDNWWLMLLFTLFWGVGSHLLMPIRSSVTMWFGGKTNRGRRLGQVGGVGKVGAIAGAGIVWFVFDYFGGQPSSVYEGPVRIDKWQFDIAFYIAAGVCVIAAVLFLTLRGVGAQEERPRLVLKSKYWLYYVLNLLFGARKQVFLTFGRWTLVRIYRQLPSTFAKLSIVASIIGTWFNPWVGRLVDRLGERKILVVDSLLLVVVSAGYGGAEHLGLGRTGALIVVFACYIIDELCFALRMARNTYMSKIAESEDDLTASLSVGITLDHAVAMSVPTFGGWLWVTYGYEWVFVAAAGLAVLMVVFASLIKVPTSEQLEKADHDEIPAGD